MSFIVYMHITPSNKRYIGITSREVEKRWCDGKGYGNQVYFANAIKKYGWDNIEHKILYTNLTKEEAIKKEKELIQHYNTHNPKYGYNMTLGGFGRLGDKQLKETRYKISEASKKSWQDPISREKRIKSLKEVSGPLSEERKRKISEGNKRFLEQHPEVLKLRGEKISKLRKGKTPWNKGKTGFKHTEATKKKIGMANKGKKLSELTKRKISEKMKGRIVSNKTRKKLSEKMKNMSQESKDKISKKIKEKWNNGEYKCNFKKGSIPWNKGLNKETSPQIKAYAEKQKGKKLTKEQREKISQACRAHFKNHDVWNKTKIECVETGVKYNSIKEACEKTGFTTIQYAIKHGSATKGFHWRKV